MQKLVGLATKLADIESELVAYVIATKQANKDLDATKDKIVAILTEMGEANTGDIPGLGRLSLCRSIYPSVNASDLQGFIDSIRETPDFRIVQETIDSRDLKIFLKERIAGTLKEFTEYPSRIEALFPNQNFSPRQANDEFWRRQGVRVFTKVGLKWTKRYVS